VGYADWTSYSAGVGHHHWHRRAHKKLFVYAPETRIKVHPHKIADGNLTALSGLMEGAFSTPMPLGDGTFAQPTGTAFKLPMATIGRWENGVMQEEWLYWDNQTCMAQIGLGK
jgi:hypothetical protein